MSNTELRILKVTNFDGNLIGDLKKWWEFKLVFDNKN